MNSNEKTVWDIGVRIFHWSLVVCFITSYLTGEENTEIHSYVGYTIIGLLTFRILWGFIGTQHARFTDFIFSPQRIIAYCKSLPQGNPEYFEGHNPAGGLMIMVMLLCLIATTYTGLKTYGAEGHGPLAGTGTKGSVTLINSAYADHDDDDDDDDDDDEHKYDRQGKHSDATNTHRDRYDEDDHDEDDAEEFWEDLHEFFVNLMILLIVIHVIAVIVSSRLHGENLVRAMFTGKKTRPDA